MNIKEFFEIFSTNCTYEKINEYNVVKLRDRGNISIIDALLYRFLYTEKNMTKERIVSSINIMNEKIITRQSFDEKEGNISEEFYLHLFTEV